MNKLSLQNAFQSYFHEKYTFDDFCTLNTSEHYREIFYSKNTYSPSSKLKEFQRFLNLFLFEKLSINENVLFSYRKGVNAKDALTPHCHHQYFLSTDIQSFFLSTDIKKLKYIILSEKENFLIEANEIKTYIQEILNIVTYKGILPVGSPSSPLLSNAYLFELDNALEKYCTQNNIIYTRYSDDFIFSSNSEKKLENITNILQEMFRIFGFNDFKINEKKTKLQKQGTNKITLLGLVVTPQGNITVDNRVKKEIEALLHFYLTDKKKFNALFAKSFASDINKVSGILSHIHSIDSFYIAKLKRKYGNFIVNSFIHRDINV